jgi:hypothetical protein
VCVCLSAWWHVPMCTKVIVPENAVWCERVLLFISPFVFETTLLRIITSIAAVSLVSSTFTLTFTFPSFFP